MNLLLASLAWLVIAAVLGLGIYWAAVAHSVWVLLGWIVGFLFLVGVIGCRH